VLDDGRLRDMFADGGADLALVLRIIDNFISRAPQDANELETATHGANAQEVTQIAHRLRGSASTLGLLRLAELCRTVERQATVSEVPEASTLASLRTDVAAGITSLRQLAKSLRFSRAEEDHASPGHP
jgi:HPt (histidine-containing phosphotransfer) domain-containing protein